MIRVMFSRRWLATTLLAMAGIVVSLNLCIWQLGRYKNSQEFNAHLVAMQNAPPLILDEASIFQDLTSMEYRSVKGYGIYDYEHQIALRNQYLGDSDGPAEFGFHLMTPLVMESGQAVLVDRGWIPGTYDTPESWRSLDGSEEANFIGVIRVPIL